ncbi:MAG: hypothetical protein M3119_06860 [Verrucomicrobiota bacterium]|nr:hypothetical protein [Verrucomicrobiota bacterium]MDQ6939862.1 hypothetical protein [Verrucomicrobiota bacterium]
MAKLLAGFVASAVFVLTPTLVRASAKVVILAFAAATPDYVVPAGKVLLIEEISPYYSGSFTKVVVTIAAVGENLQGTVTVPYSFSTSNANQLIQLTRPLRAAAGSLVNILDTDSGTAQIVRIQGLLIDQADLYAANLGIDLKAVGVANETLTATVELATSRPAILSSTTSLNLQNWVENLTQIVYQHTSQVYDVSTAIEGGDAKKFLRVSAKAPEIP